MPTPESDLPQRLEDHDDAWWADKIPRLMKRAKIKIHERTWLGLRGGDPPGGKDGRDIVYTVVRKVFDGTRPWIFAKQPDLYLFLKNQVDSEISNLVRRQENRETRRIKSAGELEPGRCDIEGVPSSIESPEEIAEAASEEEWFKARLWRFVESLDDDPALQYLVIAASEGAVKRRELAAALKVDETEVDNRIKRLKRRRREYERREDL